MQARAFCPGHITCFFSIHTDPAAPPAKQGSRGAGFSIESGVEAAVRTVGARRAAARGAGLPFELQVVDNGKPVREPRTTRACLEELVGMAGSAVRLPAELRIENRYSLPLGAGFGVSGACALSATLAANEALRLGLEWGDCVRAAHAGEVRALTGLGDVVGQAAGGLEARVHEGASPHGALRPFESAAAPVELFSFGPRPTRAFLEDTRGRERLNRTGAACLERFLRAPSLENMIRLGRNFTETLDLASRNASQLMKALDPAGMATVAMLGDSVVFVPAAGAKSRPAAVSASVPFHEKTALSPRGARLL